MSEHTVLERGFADPARADHSYADAQCGDPAGDIPRASTRFAGNRYEWLRRSVALHVNTLHPHSQRLLPLCVAQVSRQERPLLPAEGNIWVTGRPLGGRRGCRRAGWKRAAGWRWWQARCIREGVLQGGCRERHAIVPCACKPLLTGLHLCREQAAQSFPEAPLEAPAAIRRRSGHISLSASLGQSVGAGRP